MASANFMKATSQKVGAMKKHLDMDERMQRNHANKHINKELTENNYFVGTKSFGEMKRKWSRRVNEIDKKNPPKRVMRDRVTACFVEIPCPLKITEDGRSEEFFKSINNFLLDYFGKENYCGGAIHLDEVHDYFDSRTRQMTTSMEHGHFLVVPYAEWKDKSGQRKGINGKAFLNREMLIDFNKQLNQMVLERFGIELNTHGLAQKESVEELKRRTDTLERSYELENHKKKLVHEVNRLIDRKKDLRGKYEALEIQLTNTDRELEKAKTEVNKALKDKKLIDEEKEALTEALEQIQKFMPTEKQTAKRKSLVNGEKVHTLSEKEYDALWTNAQIGKNLTKESNKLSEQAESLKRREEKLIRDKEDLQTAKEDNMYLQESELNQIKKEHPELFSNGFYQPKTRTNISHSLDIR